MKVLQTDQCLKRDIHALIEIEPRFLEAYQTTGDIPLRRREDGYASLVRTIIGQQVSVASANAIWGRLSDANLIQLDDIAASNLGTLKSCGLSKQKANYLMALAEAGIDFETLETMSSPEVMECLTDVKGIGPWTAEIYLMFSLGRSDVIASGDLALQEAAKILFEFEDRPSPKELAILAQNWSPFRNAAAQLLWAYYHVMKTRDGIGL